jgi:glycosyltransferase involved in cell wall biosynthesis
VTPRLSAVLITRNEERRLGVCLASLAGLADEIVILDTMSTDGTVALARAAGARVEQAAFAGFGPAKRRALELATGDWVLSIDADERLTVELREEIRRAVLAEEGPDGYWMRRDVYYLGQRMRFGGLGHDWVLRLFRRGRGHFTSAQVHERVEVAGATESLTGRLEHHTCATLDEHLAKVQRYSALQADELAARGRVYRWWDWLRIPVELFLRIVVRLAFLDGARGMVYATVSAYGKWLRYARLAGQGGRPG